jgi:hypothetical protein
MEEIGSAEILYSQKETGRMGCILISYLIGVELDEGEKKYRERFIHPN